MFLFEKVGTNVARLLVTATSVLLVPFNSQLDVLAGQPLSFISFVAARHL